MKWLANVNIQKSAYRLFSELHAKAKADIESGEKNEMQFRRVTCRCGKSRANLDMFGVAFPCICNILNFPTCPLAGWTWGPGMDKACEKRIQILKEEDIGLSFGEMTGLEKTDVMRQAHPDVDGLLEKFGASEKTRKFYFDIYDELVDKDKHSPRTVSVELMDYICRRNLRLDKMTKQKFASERLRIRTEVSAGIQKNKTTLEDVFDFGLGLSHPTGPEPA